MFSEVNQEHTILIGVLSPGAIHAAFQMEVLLTSEPSLMCHVEMSMPSPQFPAALHSH